MNVKDWIELLEKQDPKAEVILWEWKHKEAESEYRFLQQTGNPAGKKGFFTVTGNDYFVKKNIEEMA